VEVRVVAGKALPSRYPPDRAEVVHESMRTRVTRLFFAGRTVIRKEPLGPDADRRLRHEAAVLKRLRGVAGVAQLARAPRYPGSIVLADAGGASLAGLAIPLAAGELAGLGLGLARAVEGMHRAGVLHRDITPANIVVSGSGVPCLVDFGLATSLAEIRPGFTHHAEIAGTLAYLAPEATGRTARPVDQRADLYALGAVLYELATGGPPFGSGDPLRLTHDLLARVPAPPAQMNPAVPTLLSEIIMHLLEKEPDSRYQTAEGLIYDLEQWQDAWTRPAAARLRVGEHDVPLRLLPPSRLVGRDGEVAALHTAFEQAVAGRCRGVLLAGAPGVGKTVLADQLRPAVAARDGWFVAGKFDAYRRDLEFDAVNQALRAQGRLLLAEPDEELAKVREQILDAAGPNTGLLTATVPEFADLLAVPPDPGDPLTAQVRAQRAAVAVLRSVASPNRPLVVFIDDLQWAGRTGLGVVDLVLSEEPVEGLLLVGAYREGDVETAHPLAAPLSRWRDQAGVRHLRLANLHVPSLVAMVAEMLHVNRDAAAGLVEVIGPHTLGNPYETVELLNALRRDGVLAATADGWRWDAAAVRAYLGRSEVAGLSAAHVEEMPPTSRRLVEAMACLGGRAGLNLLQAATGETAAAVDHALAPALDEGLLVMEPGAHQAVRFRHDRIRDVILGGLHPRRRRTLQLAMARRLAAVPELFAVAAEQYLPVIDAVDDPAERRAVVGLLRRATRQATLTGDYALVNTLLAAALRLIDPGETATLVRVHTGRHAALFSLGRLEEADEEYGTIERLSATALDRADATWAQMSSLTQRNRFAEAFGLGLDSLRELGITVPTADLLPAELDRQFGYLYRWLDHIDGTDDLARPDISEPTLLAAIRLLGAIPTPAYYAGDVPTYGWLSLEALRIWLEHGPARTLVGPASHAAFAAVVVRGDYAAGYRAAQRIVASGEARGYEPETSQARYVSAVLGCWFEPIEDGLAAAQRAREGLIAGGDLVYAGHVYHEAVYYQLECAPSLDVYAAEVEAGLAFLQQTGSEHTGQVLDSHQWLASVLRGGGSAAAGGAAPLSDRYAGNPLALLFALVTRAVAAAIFGDLAALARHTAAAMPLLAAAPCSYPTAGTRLLRGLALAGQVRATDGEERDGLLSELDEVTRWLAERAADAPQNFSHLLQLVEAERTWAAGDFRAAELAFDAARREAARLQRPWHRALIAERAAGFYLARGVEHVGYDLLAQARHEYLAWGATAKAAQLDWAFPALRPAPDATDGHGPGQPADLAHGSSAATTGAIDLLGILAASQALSSQTSVEGLHLRVAEVLGAMTGATGVRLLLWSEDRHDWLLPVPDSSGSAVGVSGTGHERTVPMAVLRYVQRTGEPLVVGDATGDDRFARDPYFADVACCALLAVPVLGRGTLRAVLVLENRLIRGAFTAERLDAVKLIAGQLAVSLDNAQVYAQFRRIADEQAALRRVATLVARAAPPAEVFAAVTAEAGRLLGTDHTILYRYDPDGGATAVGAWNRTGATGPVPVGSRLSLGGRNVTTLVFRAGRPARLDDYADASGPAADLAHAWGIRASVGAPVNVAGRLWGAMTAASASEEPLPADTEARLAGFTELVATAIANAEAQAALTASRARIVATADAARSRIERDLHDGAQQRLVSLALRLRAAQAAVPPDLGELATELDSLGAGLNDALDEVREIARGIHPAALAKGGLRAALSALARRSPIPVDLHMRAKERLPEHVEVSAYYVVSEALTNAARHARASAVSVEVEAVGGVLRVAVRDDGAGGAGFTGGTGLVGLKDRVEALGGRIVLDSPRGAGTCLRAELPLAATDGDLTFR
jgi:signal transduction histidine kinase